MANAYEIPWAPPDISAGAAMLLGVLKDKRNEEIARENTAIQRQYAENAQARESAAEARARQTFEQGQADRRQKAIESANELRRQRRHSEADMLLKLHGVTAAPDIGPAKVTAPEIVTPMSAASQLTAEDVPPMADTSFKYASPMAAAANTVAPPMQHGVGVTVPEEPPAPPIAPPASLAGPELPDAERDMMPLTLPGETQPGAPTGAYRYTGPKGEDLGRFDPSEEEKFRQERADRLKASFGAMGDKVTAVAQALARGEITKEEGSALLRMIQADQAAADKAKAEGEKRTFTAEENEKYKNEGLTFDQRKQLAQIGAGGRVAAARASQINPLKIDTANRQDMGTLRQGLKEWKNTINLSVDSKSHKRLATAMANLDSGNAMQQREAAESLVSIFKGGGQVTKASQDLLLHNLAGIVGDAQTFLTKMASGHYGDQELAVLRQATQNALAEEREKLDSYHESAVDTFGPGSGYEQLAGNVNAMVRGVFKQFGYDSPDIYPNATESVVLGSGKRPKAPKGGGGQLPAGAIPGTMNGKRGYVLNGHFTATE